MIVSDQYQYVFMEVPHTASTSIAEELVANYDGYYFGRKHATYVEYLRIANENQKKYFLFAGVRNPLDVAVTIYLRYKTNHANTYEAKSGEPKSEGHATLFDRHAYQIARQHDFPVYFRRYHRLPYSDAISREAKRYAGFVIRFEHLQEDFATLLDLLDIVQARPLPHTNRTATKQNDFLRYYTPDVQALAVRIFGPYMQEWGYSLPASWPQQEVSPLNKWWYQTVNYGRDFYWRHLKLSQARYGRLVRAIK